MRRRVDGDASPCRDSLYAQRPEAGAGREATVRSANGTRAAVELVHARSTDHNRTVSGNHLKPPRQQQGPLAGKRLTANPEGHQSATKSTSNATSRAARRSKTAEDRRDGRRRVESGERNTQATNRYGKRAKGRRLSARYGWERGQGRTVTTQSRSESYGARGPTAAAP